MRIDIVHIVVAITETTLGIRASLTRSQEAVIRISIALIVYFHADGGAS